MPVLKEGLNGRPVVSLQKKLKALGFNPGKIDGVFGGATKAALMDFQRAKGIKLDGLAGSQTMGVMNSIDLPLNLFQIVEEEYISLYGALSRETVINLSGRAVTAQLNWDFHSGHIKNWGEFKRFLGGSDLKVPESLGKLLAEEKIASWQDEKDAIDSFNRLLGKYFYSSEEFRHYNLGKSTEKLFELYPEDELHRISPEELREMNRFLLEEIFPEHLVSLREVRLAAIYQNRHEKPSAALCLSGGGIRSGTFALGLIQGLARHDLLKQFDYLSTVSGGGYIGGWLTAWIHRHAAPDRGLVGVTKDLTNAIPGKKIDPEPAAIRHLREYSNFLTPKVGLMSADAWTFAAIYVRNLLLNWSVIIPLLLGFLLIPRLGVAVVLAKPDFGVVLLPLIVGCLLVIWAISYIAFSRPRLRERLIEQRPWLREAMGQRGFLKHSLAPLVLAGSLLTTHWVWSQEAGRDHPWVFPGFGAGIAILALLVAIAIVGRWSDVGKSGAAVLIVTGIVGGLIVLAVTRLVFSSLIVGVDIQGGANTVHSALYVVFAVPFFLLLFMLAATLFAGISSHLLDRVSDEDREWWSRFSAWMLISAGAWLVFSALVLFGPLALLQFPKLLAAIGGASGIIALVLGKSGKTPATAEKVAQADWKTQFASYLLPLLALLFLVIFVACLSLVTSIATRPVMEKLQTTLASIHVPVPVTRTEECLRPAAIPAAQQKPTPLSIEIANTHVGDFTPVANAGDGLRNGSRAAVEHIRSLHCPRAWVIVMAIAMLFIVGYVLARIINLNLFSLHNGYRNRLIRGFLAASRERHLRRPNPFTGFDTADNVSMHELRPALLHEVDFNDLAGFANQLKMGGEAVKARAKASPPDLKTPVSLDANAESGSTTASQFLYTRLSEKGQAAVDSYQQPAPLSENQRATLLEDLNRILEADHIRLGKQPGFLLPPEAINAASDSGETIIPPPSQQREYQIHQNRRALEHTYPQFIEKSEYPPHRLLHVVNTTLNLVGGDNLAWQQRKAESFTVSPLHCGSFRVGYRRSKDYGGDDGISLGTAMAISGAAASSNMGYYTTSPLLSLVLTLFNVRLGWWLGNPGPAGSHSFGIKTELRLGEAANKIYRRMSPTLSIMPVFYEAFGLTDDRNDYVYLTDGGHFENLGLYEMVLRRCHLIVVSDGAADAKYEFNDLANAVRKVRIDLGIHIEFPDVPIYRRAPDKEGEGGCYWSIGLIRYSDIDRRKDGSKAPDGLLIYIKPAIYEDEPEDVIHYKRTHPAFPNETTADQFFDEPQFESYRALGSYIMDRMCGSHSGDLDLGQFAYRVNQNFLRMAPQVKDKYREFWESKTSGTIT